MKKLLTALMAVVLLSSAAFAQVNNARRANPKDVAKVAAVKKTHKQSLTTAPAPVAKSYLKQVANQNNSKTVISTFPYSEGFESGYSNWTLIDSDGDGVNWFLASDYSLTAHNGSDCMVSASYDNNSGVLYPDNWMVSSQIQLPASATDFELSWYDAAQDPSYPAENYAVYIATTNTVAGFTATTPVFTTVLSTDNWTKRTVSLASYAGQNIYVAFRHFNVSDEYMMKIDDIRVGTAGAPDLSISGLNSGFIGDAMTFTATCTDAAATINWTIAGATPATATGNSVSATWATAGTYAVAASATNALGTATDTLMVTIISCDNVTTLPWVDGFENGEGCWSIIDNNNDDITWEIASNQPYAGNYSAGITYASAGNDDYLISQGITIPNDGNEYFLSYYSSIANTTYPETYEVLISTTGRGAITNFTSVFNETLTSTEYVKRTVSLSSYAGQTINIAFHNTSVDQYHQFIDNVRVGGAEAPDLTLTGVTDGRMGVAYDYTATATAGSTIAWSFDGTPTVVYNTDSTVANLTWNAAGLYNVIATATNTIGSVSDTLSVNIIDCSQIASLPFVATFGETLGCWDTICDSTQATGWFTSTEMGLDEGQVLSMSAESFLGMFMFDMPVDNWLYSPQIAVPATGNFEIGWSVKPFEPTYAGDHYGVYAIVNNTPTLLFEETLSSTMTDFVPRVAALPASCAGQTIQIAFRHFNSANGYVIILDDIEVRSLSTPIVSINGPANVIANTPATFTAVCSNADSYAWTVDGAANSETSATLTYTFTTGGTHTVAVAATNTVGTSNATFTVNVIEWGDTMYYDNGTATSAVGAGGEMYWAVKYEASALAGRDYLTHVMMYAYRAGDYDVSIYQDGVSAPGTMVTTQTNTVSSADVDSWVTFQLYSTVSLDATKPLWIVMHNAGADYPAAYSDFCGDYNSSWASLDGEEWNHVQDLSSTLNCTWMIRAITGSTVPAPSVAINGPATGMAGQAISFTAVGPSDATYTWTLEGATPATATGMNVSATWNAAGNYTISVTATNANGTANASKTISIISCDAITSFPYTMSFEPEDNLSCWTFIDADGDGYGWDVDTWTGSEYVYTGEGVIGSASFINNIGALSPDNWMITPAIQLPADGTANLSWYVGGVDASYFEENYAVLVSTTGNSTSDFTHTLYDGTVESVDFTQMQASLNEYLGQTIYIAFRHYDTEDVYWMLIDDITISATGTQGIEGAEAAQVSVYPNPATNSIMVQGDNIEQIEILDINGRVMMTQAKGGKVDISALADGIYMVRTLTANGVNIQKVIKK